jgi:hypothetical protein
MPNTPSTNPEIAAIQGELQRLQTRMQELWERLDALNARVRSNAILQSLPPAPAVPAHLTPATTADLEELEAKLLDLIEQRCR